MRPREPMTLRLYRENRPIEPRVGRDVGDIVLGATLLLVLYVLGLLLFSL